MSLGHPELNGVIELKYRPVPMRTAFDLAYDAYQLRKQAEHRAHLRQLQGELARGPEAPLRAGTRAAALPKRARG